MAGPVRLKVGHARLPYSSSPRRRRAVFTSWTPTA